MSVINTMLKDLENRGGAGEAEREPVLQGLGSMNGSSPRRPGTLPIVAAGVVSTVALLLAAYLVSPYRLVSDADARPTIAVQAQSSSQDADTVAAADVQPVQVRPEAKAAAEVESPQPAAVAVPQTQPEQPAAIATAPAPKPSAKPEPENLQVPQAEKGHRVEPAAATAQAKTAAVAMSVNPVRLASADTSSAIDMQGNGGDDDVELVVTKKKRALTNREQSTQTYAIALKHYNQGDRQQARLLLREALGHDAANVAARRLLASIHLETGRPQLALETIEAGLPKAGNDRELMQLYLQINVNLGNFARAIDVMRKRRPSSPDEFGYLAGLYQKNNDHRNAVSYYSQALQIKPDQSVWWMGQGISLEALGKYSEALQSYTQSVKAGRLNSQLTEFVANRIISIEQKLEPRDS